MGGVGAGRRYARARGRHGYRRPRRAALAFTRLHQPPALGVRENRVHPHGCPHSRSLSRRRTFHTRPLRADRRARPHPHPILVPHAVRSGHDAHHLCRHPCGHVDWRSAAAHHPPRAGSGRGLCGIRHGIHRLSIGSASISRSLGRRGKRLWKWLAAHPLVLRFRRRRPVRCRHRELAGKISMAARSRDGLHLRHHRRGAGDLWARSRSFCCSCCCSMRACA